MLQVARLRDTARGAEEAVDAGGVAGQLLEEGDGDEARGEQSERHPHRRRRRAEDAARPRDLTRSRRQVPRGKPEGCK